MTRFRTFVVMIGIAGVLFGLASPAGAKGVSSASFTGPGLPPGGIRLHVGPHDPKASAMFFQTGAFSVHQGAAPWAEGLDRADLRAPYVMTVTPDWDANATVRLIVYPYARGGAWTYTAPGQSMGGDTVDAGWWKVGDRLIGSDNPQVAVRFRSFLVSLGFPQTAPPYEAPDTPLPGRPVPPAVATHPAPVPVPTSWPVWAWALIASVMGAGVLLVASRQRRRLA
jgi:hypothetical protein